MFVDVSDTSLREDARPLVEGCTCYTCRSHTRAYLYHLHTCREMILPTLLDFHNTHHVHLLMAELRTATKQGRLVEAAKLYEDSTEPQADPETGALVGF